MTSTPIRYGRYVYATNELDGTVNTYTLNPDRHADPGRPSRSRS